MNSINFFCNLTGTTTPLPHFWEHTVGSDHAPIALRADWQRQLRRCHRELGFQYVRFHGLLYSQWIEEFVAFCERNKVPADFITTLISARQRAAALDL